MKKCAENKFLLKWDILVENVTQKKTAKDFIKIKTLAVFDFDKTLFRSPDAPNNHKGNWHIKIDSLSPPYVKEVADETMWIIPIVEKAKSLIAKQDTYCIMLTGRIGNIFEDRVKELLSQKGLFFDHTWLNEFGGDTVENKIQTIDSFIKRMPNLQNIVMWEDKEDQAKKFSKKYSQSSYSFKINLVDEAQLKNTKLTIKIKIKK